MVQNNHNLQSLSSCYLSEDDHLEALIAQAEAIQREERLTLRLRV